MSRSARAAADDLLYHPSTFVLVYADTMIIHAGSGRSDPPLYTFGTVPGKDFYSDVPPSEVGEQREVRPAVEGQGSKAPASPPPHEITGFLVQPAMLGGRDLKVELSISAARPSRESPRTSISQRSASASNFDQSARPQVAALKRPSRQRGARWWTSSLASATITPPWLRLSSSLR